MSSPDYPLPERSVDHHYFINNPTNLLEIKLDFEDGSIIDGCEALSFVGRTFADCSIDHVEVGRIRNGLRVEEFLGGKIVTLTVDKPRFGDNYAIRWSLSR